MRRLVLGLALLCLVYLFCLLSPSPLTAAPPEACPDGDWHDGTRSQPPIPAGERHCHDVHLDGVGQWLIDVQVAPSDPVEARITLPSPDCAPAGDPDGGSPPRVVLRRASSVVLEVRSPGRYTFCVGSRDPHVALGGYRLISTFAPHALGKSDPDEDEPDPDPVILPGGASRQHVSPSTKDHRPSTLGTELVVSACASWPALRRDDHGDAWPCATRLPIGRSVDGTLEETAPGDHDVFRLELDAWRTIEVRSSSTTDMAAALYNGHGHRLATDDDGAGGGDFRIVQHLAPGVYFLRVASPPGLTGRYRLYAGDVD